MFNKVKEDPKPKETVTVIKGRHTCSNEDCKRISCGVRKFRADTNHEFAKLWICPWCYTSNQLKEGDYYIE